MTENSAAFEAAVRSGGCTSSDESSALKRHQKSLVDKGGARNSELRHEWSAEFDALAPRVMRVRRDRSSTEEGEVEF